MKLIRLQRSILLVFLIATTAIHGYCQEIKEDPEFDKKIRTFLENNPGTRGGMNVPASDGQLLYNLIIENGYTSALEIGTSTGYSTLWIAWALKKTGGKMITIDINETRHKIAVSRFEELGLDGIIDARLADAHELVPELEGPFDFVFSDADKVWYKNYFNAVDPKLEVGGCYATHNVSEHRRYGSNSDYLNYLKSLSNYSTTVNYNGSGMAISYKKSK